jgi:hypothetical protein
MIPPGTLSGRDFFYYTNRSKGVFSSIASRCLSPLSEICAVFFCQFKLVSDGPLFCAISPFSIGTPFEIVSIVDDNTVWKKSLSLIGK